MTSKGPQMTSKDLRKTLKNTNENTKRVKSKNNLGGGDPNDDNPINGRDLVEHVFSSTWMVEFIEIIKKGSKFQTEITQSIEKYNEESYSTQSKIVQNALMQNEVF